MQMMHAAPRIIPFNSSSSPLAGEGSVFCDPMVMETARRVNFTSAPYSVDDLTGVLSGTDHREQEMNVQQWIARRVRGLRNLSVLQIDTALPFVTDLPPFYTSSLVRPDVTVVEQGRGLPVLTVEVLFGTIEATRKKALINAITQLRIWRAFGVCPEACVAFVFPGNESRISHATKVAVTFSEFIFKYKMTCLEQDQVETEIAIILSRPWPSPNLQPQFSFFIRLSQDECDEFEAGAVQVASSSSLIVRNQRGSVYWKYSRKHTETFYMLESLQKISKANYLQHSLLHSSHVGNNIIFYRYEGLSPPFSRADAKEHLLPLVEGVKVALEELHGKGIAHMDIRLPNICHDSHGVKLIDLDRCQSADVHSQALYVYAASDMYTMMSDTWNNSQVDWRCLGMMICYVLDDEVSDQVYHQMLSQRKVTNGIDKKPLLRSLLEEGQWNERAWSEFQAEFQRYNTPL